ncbi:hypothetical protein BLOT_015997 [Blomia tropicalis]|nr:hypothetical protein BLOT_015997 [Blomia tropicalis]
MAETNGETKVETADSFARDYLDNLFNNSKNLGAFEEETLDLNIKSKYDDIVVDDDAETKTTTENGVENNENGPIEPSVKAEFVESVANEEKVNNPPEPENSSFQTNDHEESKESVQEANHSNGVIEPEQSNFSAQPEESAKEADHSNDCSTRRNCKEADHSNDVVEPEQSNFSAQPEESVKEANHSNDVIEPEQSNFSSQPEESVKDANHSNDVVEPEQSNFSVQSQETNGHVEINNWNKPIEVSTPVEEVDEVGEMNFGKLGLKKSWWQHKDDGENKQPVDKFRTIKQNIRKGNTRSLMARPPPRPRPPIPPRPPKPPPPIPCPPIPPIPCPIPPTPPNPPNPPVLAVVNRSSAIPLVAPLAANLPNGNTSWMIG